MCRPGPWVNALLLVAAASGAAADQPTAAVDGTTLPSPDEIYDAGKALFDQYAPPEMKRQFEFPSQAQWDEFAARLQGALEGGSFEDLAAYAPEARAALVALRTLPGDEDYATWLEQRLDLIEAAGQVGRPPPPGTGAPPPKSPMPHYDLWVKRLRDRPAPPGAAEFMPDLRAAFAAEGVPADLAWMAEVESSFNPGAHSPAGARGLFQLMPDTARALGLRTSLPDERTDPTKCAHAAARLLRRLRGRFGDWPLALAAYNAGEGRVARVLAARQARTFAAIEPALPAETRLYVPKVCATIAVRGGAPPLPGG